MTKAGVALSVWQLGLFFLMNKSISSMWILIHTLQFLVFIGRWQINYPDPVKAIFSQLGRIAFGEYLDGITIATSSS